MYKIDYLKKLLPYKNFLFIFKEVIMKIKKKF